MAPVVRYATGCARILSRSSPGLNPKRGPPGAARIAQNARMQLMINVEPREFPTGATLAALLRDEGLGTRRVAVEVNGQIVPRSLHDAHVLQPGDLVEIVHALGGG